MPVAFGWLGLTPPVFWAMTPREFRHGLEGWRELRGLRSPGLAAEEVAALQAFLAEGRDG